jgi:hypothetical protein
MTSEGDRRESRRVCANGCLPANKAVLRGNFCYQADLFNAVHAASESM